MNFRRRRSDEPEINLIPFIDVLLVILIFLMLSTTYNKFTELKVNLPSAEAEAAKDYPKELIVGVAANGSYTINKTSLAARDASTLAAELATAAGGSKEVMVIISADAQASHQSVVNVMDAARRAGLTQLTFATQGTGSR
jgi:biopolymer transport protein ExbD